MKRTSPSDWPKRRPNPKETIEDLSPDMRSALEECFERGVHPYQFASGPRDKWDDRARWSTNTRAALVKNGLIHLVKNKKGRPLWRATDSGRAVVMAKPPRFLMPAGRPRRIGEEPSDADLGYTTVPAFAMRGEPEAA